MREIDFAHSTRAEQRLNLIMADPASDERRAARSLPRRLGGGLSGNGRNSAGERRFFDEVAGLFERVQQRLDLLPQFAITDASRGEKTGARAGFARKRRMKQLFDALPTLRRHPALLS